MSNSYFRFDTTLINSAKRGRLYSTKPAVDVELPNGIIGYMSDYVTDEIRTLVVPTADLIKNKIPVITGNPEINYREESLTDSALGAFRNYAGRVLRTYPLAQYDVFTYSEDFFDMTGKATPIAKGDMFTLQANLVAGTQLKYSATVPAVATNKVYFKVLKVSNSHIPTFVSGTGSLYPAIYKVVEVEMIIAE